MNKFRWLPTTLLVNSRVASIDTRAACSIVDSTPWRWAYTCNASRITRVSPRVLPGVSTFPSFVVSRPTRGGIGAEGFNTDAGSVVDVGAGTSVAAAGAGDGAATGTDFDMGT